MTSGLVT